MFTGFHGLFLAVDGAVVVFGMYLASDNAKAMQHETRTLALDASCNLCLPCLAIASDEGLVYEEQSGCTRNRWGLGNHLV